MDTSWIGPILAQYGLPGILLFVSFWVIKVLYERNTSLADRYITDAIANARADEELANALKGLTEIIKERRAGNNGVQ